MIGETTITPPFDVRKTIQVTQAAAQSAHLAKLSSDRNSAVTELNGQVEELIAQIDQTTAGIRKMAAPEEMTAAYDRQLAQGDRNLREEIAHRAQGTALENGQANLARGQVTLVAGQVHMLNEQARQSISNDRQLFANIDSAIKRSACLAVAVQKGGVMPDMGVCKRLDQAISNYRPAKERGEGVLAEREALVQAKTEKMKDIMRQAGLTVAP